MTFSQDYYPLIEEDRTWNVLNIIPSGWEPPFDTTYNTESWYIKGDTIISTYEYKILHSSSEPDPTSWTLRGFMREDSTKKVWLRWKNDIEEILIYDFSLSIGDSISIGYMPEYYHIDSITSVEINGTTRNKYWISQEDYDWNDTWIEGIGSNKGIVQGMMLIGGWSWLLCMSDYGELIYMNPNYESCYLITEINETEKQLIHIYPNPAKNTLIIENVENFGIKSISILNQNGQEIKQFESRLEQLDLSEIKSGLYFLRISLENGQLIKKIVIEK
jgi:hypothetical protein